VWRGGWVILDGDGKEMPKESLGKSADHWRDFVDCVKSRSTPRADLRSVAQTTITCHLANASLWANAPVKWNKAKWDIEGKAGKDTMAYRRPYRAPHKLTHYPAV
jgi:cytochrome c5